MGNFRRAFLSVVFAGLLLGSAYDVVTDQEHWPFSQYPMFSGVWTSPSFTWLRLFGVTEDGREFPLDENRYIAPFDQSRLPKALRQILARRNADAEVVTALRDCFDRYHELADRGRHDGPQLAALRLYELEWELDRTAVNVDHPTRRTFLAEVRPE